MTEMEYAKKHALMILLLVVFLGVLVVPRFYTQARRGMRHAKINGVVKTIYFSQDAPPTSYVEITYNINGKEYSVRELLDQHVRVGDHLEVYADGGSVLLQRPSIFQGILLLVAYVFVAMISVYGVYVVFLDNGKPEARKKK